MEEKDASPPLPLAAEQLMRFLPHRPPFFFLKRLIEWEPGKRATSEVEFDGSEDFFRGHFPGSPIVPGVILIEAAAQTAGFALGIEPRHDGSALPALAKVKEFRFRGPARPRELLHVEANVSSRFGTIGVVAVAVRRGATRLAEGELTVALSAPMR
jgi:3-hydroxyacyl-[acyl-carrier-protein] dehydratase